MTGPSDDSSVIIPVKVRFRGETYWHFRGDDGSGALAYLHHCDEHGVPVDLATALLADSFAHVCADGLIRRYRVVIGKSEELAELAA